MFNENSGLVKIWVRNVNENGYNRGQVPKLSNLQEVVYAVLDTSQEYNLSQTQSID